MPYVEQVVNLLPGQVSNLPHDIAFLTVNEILCTPPLPGAKKQGGAKPRCQQGECARLGDHRERVAVVPETEQVSGAARQVKVE
jgi:hypothetical protein